MDKSFSFPKAFEERMQNKLHDSWPAFLSVHQSPSPTSIRINPNKSQEKQLRPVPWTKFGYHLDERPSFTMDPLFHGGAYYVQEASSMFLEQALQQSIDLTQPLKVLDLCAAPGGKSTHVLSLINAESLLVCNDTIQSRATILAENIQKWGHHNVVVTNSDPSAFQSLEGFFDVIIVDAPCSGEGLFRKDENAMSEWSEENVKLCALRQRRVLNEVWPALKTGGVLIYSTCTYNEAENEENLRWLVQENKGESIKLKVEPAWHVDEVSEGISGYRFFPHQVQGEGFFISVVRKLEPQDDYRIHKSKSYDFAPQKIQLGLREWFAQSEDIQLIMQDDLILAWPKAWVQEIDFLKKHLRVVQRGTGVATAKHDQFIPEHAFALSLIKNNEAFNAIELTQEQAISFLKKDVLNLPGEKGFALMTYQGVGLGWMNLLGNRANNLYPSAWRIRM